MIEWSATHGLIGHSNLFTGVVVMVK